MGETELVNKETAAELAFLCRGESGQNSYRLLPCEGRAG
jgi:hypothetical protein